jgi:outer membrane lipoprotein-sorting protein
MEHANAIGFLMMLHMPRGRAPLLIASLCFAFVVAGGAVARADSALSAFEAAVDALRDYTVTIAVHETEGGRTQDRAVRYWYKKPTTAKIEVISGAGRGSVGVWRGGDSVRGHQGGFLGMIKLTVGLHDARAVSLRGDTIDSAYFGNILERIKTTKGELSEAPGPAIAGVPTEAITLNVADPNANQRISREVVYLSRETHLPVKRERFEGDVLVKSQFFSNLKLNLNLTDQDFAQ